MTPADIKPKRTAMIHFFLALFNFPHSIKDKLLSCPLKQITAGCIFTPWKTGSPCRTDGMSRAIKSEQTDRMLSEYRKEGEGPALCHTLTDRGPSVISPTHRFLWALAPHIPQSPSFPCQRDPIPDSGSCHSGLRNQSNSLSLCLFHIPHFSCICLPCVFCFPSQSDSAFMSLSFSPYCALTIHI